MPQKFGLVWLERTGHTREQKLPELRRQSVTFATIQERDAKLRQVLRQADLETIVDVYDYWEN